MPERACACREYHTSRRLKMPSEPVWSLHPDTPVHPCFFSEKRTEEQGPQIAPWEHPSLRRLALPKSEWFLFAGPICSPLVAGQGRQTSIEPNIAQRVVCFRLRRTH